MNDKIKFEIRQEIKYKMEHILSNVSEKKYNEEEMLPVLHQPETDPSINEISEVHELLSQVPSNIEVQEQRICDSN
jgi:hypothetical protein